MLSLIARCAGVGVLGLILFASGGHQASAVQVPVDVPDSSWLTVGPLKLANVAFPNGSYPCQGLIAFSPLGIGNTGEFQAIFQIPGVSSVDVEGVYSLPKPGKPVLTLDVAQIQAELGPANPIQKATIKTKFKKQNGVDNVQLSFDLKFEACDIMAANGTIPCAKARLSYKGAGIRFEI